MNISEFAKAAGVSKSAVSRYFNDGYLSDEKRAIINIPVIIVGQRYNGFSCVCHDDYGASYAVAEAMLNKGAVRPAYIGATEEDYAVGTERRRGFMTAAKDIGVEVEERYCTTAEFSIDSGYGCAKRIFREKPMPDCVFCATDTIASGVVMYCRENNIRVPEDVMIGSVGDAKIGRVLSLTTAHLHYRTAGAEAARMMLSAIYEPDSIPRTMQMSFELIERESTNI